MNKINLISPPDKLYNNHKTFNLVCATQKEKENLSFALSKNNKGEDIDIYVYNNENNLLWLLDVINRKNYTYLNLDNLQGNVVQYTSYIVSLPNVYYYTKDLKTKAIYELISTNLVESFDKFIEKVLNDK